MDTGFEDDPGTTADETLSSTSTSTSPSEVQCFYEARALRSCPAPQITAAYLGTCGETQGLVIVGHFFQSVDRNNYPYSGSATTGPTLSTRDTIRDTWNELTAQRMCATSGTYPGVGTAIEVRNPDGKLSNSVVVEDRRSNSPPLPTTGSDDPFDLDACSDPVMTSAEALERFDAGADSAALGSFTVVSQSRPCNSITGCAARGAVTQVTTLPLGLGTNHPSFFNVVLDGRSCNRLVRNNTCYPGPVANSDYQVRVGSTCAQIRSIVRTAIQANGNYTRTDYVGLLRY